jgi:hypothetical protein
VQARAEAPESSAPHGRIERDIATSVPAVFAFISENIVVHWYFGIGTIKNLCS